MEAASARPLLSASLSRFALNLPFLTTTTRPAPPPPPTTTTTTTTIAEPPPNGQRLDTGLTRVRVRIDTTASWATLAIDNTQIAASKTVATTGKTKVTSLGPTLGVSSSGSATIDLVLRIAQGAQPRLTSCKSYLGSTTFTLTRMTNADTVVASVTNNGHSAGGTCDNLRHDSVARSALIGPVRWPARVDSRPLVLAGYYPWYDSQDWYSDDEFGDPPRGPADTSDPAVVGQAIDLAWNAGVDGFIIEYDGMPMRDPRIDAVYEKANAHGVFQAGMMLDFDILQAGGQATPSGLDRALNTVARNAGQPSQLKFNGQPVVFLYATWHVNAGDWQQALTKLRNNTGLSPFFIAEDGNLASPGRYRYVNNQNSGAEMTKWAQDHVYEFRIAPGLNGLAGPLWVAPVSPGYDASRLGRPTPFVDRGPNGERFIESWRGAWEALPDWVFITSWNEYWEQTHIAPGANSGERALDQNADRAGHFHTTG